MLYFAPWKKLLILGICLAGILFAAPNLFYETADKADRAITAIETGRYAESPRAPGFSPEVQAELKPLSVLEAEAEAWPSWMPPGVVNLGLDLRGGVHLLVEVQVQEVFEERYKNLRVQVSQELRDEGIRRRIPRNRDHVRVDLPNPADMPRALEVIQRLAQPVTGGIAGGFGMAGGLGQMDLAVTQTGDSIRVELSEAGEKAIIDRTMAQSVEIMRRRIDETGTREPTIQRQGERRILIQVPGLSS
ncbi:MAG: protein translocase subunit SecD, partial [Pseudomonadota bacterium]